jgi:hypothetical protein
MERAEDLQDGKLAWFKKEHRCKHEANTGSKHGQGCKQEPTKDEQSVPPAHCGYWSVQINMNHGSANCKCPASEVVTQEPPSCHIASYCAAECWGRGPDDSLEVRN